MRLKANRKEIEGNPKQKNFDLTSVQDRLYKCLAKSKQEFWLAIQGLNQIAER